MFKIFVSINTDNIVLQCVSLVVPINIGNKKSYSLPIHQPYNEDIEAYLNQNVRTQ